MPIGDPYATLAQLKAYLKIDPADVQDDVELTSALGSVSQEINDHCGRQFQDAGAVSARTFWPASPMLVFVDDFHTTVGLVVAVDTDDDGIFETTLTLTVDYELRPANGVVNGQPGWSYTSIRIRRSSPFRFTGLVQVTARWGWAAVPKPIYEATLILAKDTHALRQVRFGVAGFNGFGDVRVRDNQMAQRKVARYERLPVKVG